MLVLAVLDAAVPGYSPARNHLSAAKVVVETVEAVAPVVEPRFRRWSEAEAVLVRLADNRAAAAVAADRNYHLWTELEWAPGFAAPDMPVADPAGSPSGRLGWDMPGADSLEAGMFEVDRPAEDRPAEDRLGAGDTLAHRAESFRLLGLR